MQSKLIQNSVWICNKQVKQHIKWLTDKEAENCFNMFKRTLFNIQNIKILRLGNKKFPEFQYYDRFTFEK